MTTGEKNTGARSSIWHFIFITLLFAVGIEMLRLFMSSLLFYMREAREVSTVGVGGVAFLCFLMVFLAPVVARGMGPGGVLQLSAAGLWAARIIIQFVDVAVVDFALSIAGAVLFLWAIPASASLVSNGKRIDGGTWLLGLLVGVALDTAIKGGFGTVDLSWQNNVGADVIAVLLAGGLTGSAKIISIRSRGQKAQPPSNRGSLLLLALGPFLFLEMLYFQNIGQQTALIEWDQPGVLALIVASNLVGLALATIVMGLRRHRALILVPAATILLIVGLLAEQTGALAAVVMPIGHLMLVLLLASLASRNGPELQGRRFTSVTLFSGVGMLVFLGAVFLYYAAYDISVGVPQRAIIIGAAVFIGVTVLVGTWGRSVERPRAPFIWAGRVAALLMLSPLILTITWSEPEVEAGDGLPVRVMAYNIHQGFGTEGGFELEEIARVIEVENPDIIALQEVSRGWLVDGSVDILTWLSQRLDMDYAWGHAADSVWGNAVFSRYPIVLSENHEMPNNDDLSLNRGFLWVEIDIGEEEPLRIVATHFHAGRDEGEHRIPQSEAILERWGGLSRTVILGDLNGRPGDREITMLEEAGLLDSFVDSGAPGEGFTSPSDGPHQRIDYVWTSPDLKSTEFSSTRSQASDHFPVATTINAH